MPGDPPTLSGKTLFPGGGSAAQSQYGIRKFAAAATYRSRAGPLG